MKFWITQAPLAMAPSPRASVEQGWDQWMLPQGVSMQGALTLSLILLDFFPNSSVPFLGDFEGTCSAMSESHMGVGQICQSCLHYLIQTSLARAGKRSPVPVWQVRNNPAVRCLPGRVVLPTRASLGLRTVFI